MTDATFAYDDGDIDTNRSNRSPHLNDLVVERYSRRQALMGGMSAASAAVFGGFLLSACGNDNPGFIDPGPLVLGAGSSGTTTAGMTVTLTGTVSGSGAAGQFIQTAGPPVTLALAGNTATFTAPGVAAPTVLSFTFSVPGAPSASTNVTINPAVLGFTAVPKSLADVVSVPAGYSVTVLYRLGDPIAAGVSAYANDGTDTNFAQRAGDHHDGMSWFGLAATGTGVDYFNNTRGVLVMNHENITQNYLHVAGATAPGGIRPEAEARKEIEAHGVSVIEAVRTGSTWAYVQASSLNRRITPFTPMSFSGPVRGNAALVTRFSTDGTAGRGTINNCANGTMPWNTYLTAEENWAGYFRRNAGDAAVRIAAGRAKDNIALARYAITEGRTGNYGWSTVVPAVGTETGFARWNITAAAGGTAATDFRNEANQFGWIVEIDPYNPAATPRKRTALGRMNHEGCEAGRMIPGVRPAFYMGDDAQNEYIYKFVSATPWVAADANAADRLAIGDKYLDSGTLYVARFDANGTGTWLPLVFGQNGLTSANATYPFADQADLLINVRLAADFLGATRMDRPEWTAVNPASGEMYCTLTNNGSRTSANADAANPRAYSDPRTTGGATNGNANGHIVRLREAGDSSEATTFSWDIYAFGAGSDLDATNVNLSGLDATNDFSSPDGLWFGRASNPTGAGAPILWVQTDDGAFTDVTNCMMLAAIPGTVGDGAVRSVTNTLGGTTRTVQTRAGKLPGTTLRRFMVGPKDCEITGITSTADGRAVFVNIQHPGDGGTLAAPSGNWPQSQATGSGTGRPRSATIVVTKNDGGIVGL